MAEVVLLLRVVLGVFFMISGYHKLFNPIRRRALIRTMLHDRVIFPRMNCWTVPMVEFGGGILLIVGLFTPFVAIALFVICGVALIVDGLYKIPAMKPLNGCDELACLLYLPEVLYCLMLLPVIASGYYPPYSLDLLVRAP